MVWCYCSICGKSGKVEETRKPLSSTSQSFNISILPAEDLITLFLASNIEQRMEQEAENEVEHEVEEIDNEEIEQIKKFKEH
ncbi:hypothetical protein F8M41_005127 [Gigaspora margarita]|uniref:Uncharacterized protein n=1 Tax=Gigaspora margarita TaxID=4874 RepID=A0A8H4A734_GIGMA|nr:hypothetical protein F8M41_005127 [Gigaspora margarita]